MTEQKICQEVERTLGREICSTRDFEWLSQLLRQRIGEQVSASTLKRLWGYVPYDGEPRLSTLNTLARFIGYPSYAAFESTGQAAQSNLVLGKKVTSDDLRTGDRIRLAWQPNRLCVVRHLGNGRFVVEQSENAKISAGDTFSCHLFIHQEPLYIDDLVHDGKRYEAYVAGAKSGIVFDVIPQQP